jgi:hypothetical protein
MNKTNEFYKQQHSVSVEEDDMYGHFLDIEQQTTLTHRIIIRHYKGGYVVSQTDLASIQSEPMRMFRNIVPVEKPVSPYPAPPNTKTNNGTDDDKTHIYEDKYVFVVSKINVIRYTVVCIVSALFGCANAILTASANTEFSGK